MSSNRINPELSDCHASSVSSRSGEARTIPIILGGTSFMGLHLVNLLKMEDGLEVVFVLNRGTKYWVDTVHDRLPATGNSDLVVRATPRLVHVPMDREDSTSVLSAFTNVALSARTWFADNRVSFVICDFSCDDDVFMKRVWRALASSNMLPSLRAYILISTDSVYLEASAKDAPGSDFVGGIREDFPCVPSTRKGYSGEKVRAEEAFSSCLSVFNFLFRDHFRWYVFRLPDVLGPYDNSGRFWACLLWALSGVPLLLKEEAAREHISIVSGVDVARLCYRLVTTCYGASNEPPASGIYNLGCREVITVRDLVDSIATRLSVGRCRIFGSLGSGDNSSDSPSSSSEDDDDERDAVSADYYPSVSCGPLSISAATENLGWAPTAADEVLASSTDFFLLAPRRGSEYRRAYAKLPTIVKASFKAVL